MARRGCAQIASSCRKKKRRNVVALDVHKGKIGGKDFVVVK